MTSFSANSAHNKWTQLLAEKINTEHSNLRAGVKSSTGNIVTVNGKSDVFSKAGSNFRVLRYKSSKLLEAVEATASYP
ncbi:hypothetical protein [Acinetobacter radioresistens]|uniref:hypothetical protein n=1 Tax=Acinetobacter radioresistens TaxID=40216 RepID=UPI00148AE0C0